MSERRLLSVGTTYSLAVFGALSIFLAYHSYAFEDAFITYRYAQNLAAGNGFVFNPGDRVLGTSTPLYALLLAIPGVLGLDIAVAGAALFAASLAAAAVLGAGALRQLGHPSIAVLFAGVLVWGPSELPNFFGMETPFYVALLFAAFRAGLARRELAAGVLTGLAFLTRHDAALFAACLFALVWAGERRFPWRAFLACGAIVTPWLLFAAIYFGSAVPNTLTAKAGEVSALTYVGEAAARQMWNLFSPLYTFVPRGRWPPVVVYGVTAALLGPLILALRRLVRRNPLWALTVAFPTAMLLGYSAIGASPNFEWYLLPGTYFLLLGAFASWGLLLEGRRCELISAVAAAVVVVATIGFLLPRFHEHAKSLTGTAFHRGRTGVYLTLARWIRDQGLGDVSVLLDEPGYFAYHSGSPMIDGAGLITKGIFLTGPVTRRTRAMEILRSFSPGLVVSAAVAWPEMPADYLPVYCPVPVRTLYIRRSLFEERFSELSRRWLSRTASLPDPVVPLHHPLYWDFERFNGAWTTGGGVGEFIGHPVPVLYENAEVKEDYLHTFGAPDLWGTVSSPSFLIDFDELAFRFVGTHPLRTRARLLVEGQEVLSQFGGDHGLELRDVRWPLSAWAGKVGVLQFQDADTEGGFLVADQVRSKRYRRKRTIYDSETEPDRFWIDGFASSPLEEVAKQWGLAMLVGRRATTTRDLGGSLEITSRPFRIDRANLSFLVFDFGGAETKIALRVEGRTQRAFVGSGTERLQAVEWRVREFRGSEAALVLIDQAPTRQEWIGVDDVEMFDR